MPWTVKVETERGQLVDNDFGVEFDEIPSGPEYPICSSVARYYVTLLNPPQLETFVSEWDRAITTPEFARLKNSKFIRDVAERCASEHLYLKFIGD
jgi:hypothetical protein